MLLLVMHAVLLFQKIQQRCCWLCSFWNGLNKYLQTSYSCLRPVGSELGAFVCRLAVELFVIVVATCYLS